MGPGPGMAGAAQHFPGYTQGPGQQAMFPHGQNPQYSFVGAVGHVSPPPHQQGQVHAGQVHPQPGQFHPIRVPYGAGNVMPFESDPQNANRQFAMNQPYYDQYNNQYGLPQQQMAQYYMTNDRKNSRNNRPQYQNPRPRGPKYNKADQANPTGKESTKKNPNREAAAAVTTGQGPPRASKQVRQQGVAQSKTNVAPTDQQFFNTYPKQGAPYKQHPNQAYKNQNANQGGAQSNYHKQNMNKQHMQQNMPFSPQHAQQHAYPMAAGPPVGYGQMYYPPYGMPTPYFGQQQYPNGYAGRSPHYQYPNGYMPNTYGPGQVQGFSEEYSEFHGPDANGNMNGAMGMHNFNEEGIDDGSNGAVAAGQYEAWQAKGGKDSKPHAGSGSKPSASGTTGANAREAANGTSNVSRGAPNGQPQGQTPTPHPHPQQQQQQQSQQPHSQQRHPQAQAQQPQPQSQQQQQPPPGMYAAYQPGPGNHTQHGQLPFQFAAVPPHQPHMLQNYPNNMAGGVVPPETSQAYASWA